MTEPKKETRMTTIVLVMVTIMAIGIYHENNKKKSETKNEKVSFSISKEERQRKYENRLIMKHAEDLEMIINHIDSQRR